MKTPIRITSTVVCAVLMFSTSSFAHEPQRKAAKEAESAAADVYIKIPDIPGESKEASVPAKPAAMNKGEIISEIADKPVETKRRVTPVQPAAVIAPATPAPQADGDDNSSTKSGSINTIRTECTLEEKLKDTKICKKD